MHRRKAKREVPQSLYEFNDKELNNRWNNIFDKISKECKLVPHRSSRVVKSLLPEEVFEALEPIIQFDDVRVRESIVLDTTSKQSEFYDDETWIDEDEDKEAEVEEYQNLDWPPGPSILRSEHKISPRSSSKESDLNVQPPTDDHLRSQGKFINDVPNPNAYSKFHKRSEKNAACWRPKEQPIRRGALDLNVLLNPDLSLLQKAGIITDTIACEFCAWLRGLGGIEQSSLTEELLGELFEIGFDMPAAKSLCVYVRELPVVSSFVANATGFPKASTHAGLMEEIYKDVRAEAKPARLVSFGRCMPTDPPLRFKPPRNQVRKNWLGCSTVPKELFTMAEVWKHITKLRSTKSFCAWMSKHPEIQPPPFLEKMGMVTNPKTAGRISRKAAHHGPRGKRSTLVMLHEQNRRRSSNQSEVSNISEDVD